MEWPLKKMSFSLRDLLEYWYLKSFCSFLSHFSLKELEDVVFVQIEMGIFERIVRKLSQKRMPLTKTSIIKMTLHERLRSKSIDWLHRNLCILRLLDVVTHNQKLKWSSYQLKKSDGQIYKNCSRIEEAIQSRMITLRRVMDVDVIAHECLYWISMMERIRKPGRGATIKTPMFVGYVLGQPYFFVTQNGRKDDILNVVCKSLGFKKFEDCNLSGKNIHHLLKLLRNRKACASSAEDVLEWKKENIAASAIQTQEGADFVLEQEKERFFCRRFPNEPTIQRYTITSAECDWDVTYIVPGMKNKKFREVKCTFQSPNLMQMFQELGKNGLFKLPLPEYIGGLQTNARDSMKLGHN